MRKVLVLATINAILWGALVAFAPGSHFARLSSYKFWWFDDAPWASLIVSVIVPVLMTPVHFRNSADFKRAAIIAEVILLLAIMPYLAMSGGGI
jgi:hypothetical protein